MHRPTLLIVEDEDRQGRIFQAVLNRAGYDSILANSGEEAIRLIQNYTHFDCILTDLQLGTLTGLDILQAAKELTPDVPVLILTGHASVKSAVEAMQKGAYDYIAKPVDNDELRLIVARALDLRRLTAENRVLREGIDEQYGFDHIVSVSPQMQLVKQLAREVAQTDAAVLITGESGTGKDLLARAIHQASARARGPLVALNCAGIPDHLLESELFGYEKGAFTDAKKAKPGRFQMANRGTLFLDEIGEMSLGAQAKLLRVLEHHLVEPLGGVRSIKVDLRIIAATNQDLPELIKKERFRLDLYYRLNVYQLRLPALRERPEDIQPIFDSFQEIARRKRGSRVRRISSEALSLMQRYAWPGNVRELHNLVEWLTITCKDEEIQPRHLPPTIHIGTAVAQEHHPDRFSLLSLGLSIEEVEKAMLQEALERTGGNISEASRLLKITRNTLRYRMAKHHLGG